MKKQNQTLSGIISLTPLILILCFSACQKKEEGPLTNLHHERWDASQAVEITDAVYNSDVVLKDRVNGVDYIISEHIAVNAALQIEPGVTLMFKPDAGLQVNPQGSLTAIGTCTGQIYFVSQTGKRGSWKGITILSTQPKNVISNCYVEHGGGSTAYGRANIIIGSATNKARCEINRTEITASSAYGVVIAEGSEVTHFEYNKLFTNSACPVSMFIGNAGQLSNTNQYATNGKEFIELTATGESNVAGGITLTTNNEPYLVSGCIRLSGAFSIQPGARLYMDKDARIVVDGISGSGSFSAVGTQAQPITIGSAYPGTGIWGSISFLSSASADNRFEYCNISGGGAGGMNADSGMINVLGQTGSSSIIMRHCSIMNSGLYGVVIQDAQCTYNSDIISSNTFSNNYTGNILFQ